MGSKYVSKSVTFNRNSNKQMSIWNYCRNETNDFKSQNFADFIREKLEWCINHENESFTPSLEESKPQTGWINLI